MNQRDQKLRNRERVLTILRSSPGISQAEIAERARLQPSTTSNLIRRLRELGIVESIGKRDSGPQGGKKADNLSLRAEHGQFGGIYLKEDEIISGVVDFTGEIISRKRLSVPYEDDEALLSAMIEEVEANAGRYDSYLGTGIAVSSIVNLEGDITESLYFNRAIPKLVAEIRRRVPGLPVVVDNDANCAADWDLFFFGPEVQNFVHLQVQTSPVTVGAGIIINGGLYRGTTGAAGELMQAENRGKNVVEVIDRTARLVAALLDTQAVFVAGEIDGETVQSLRRRAAGFEKKLHKKLHILDNPDIPVLGASLQAIRVHINQIQWEQ